MKDFDRFIKRFREFGGLRLVWQYARMGVLWVGVKEVIRCAIKGRSFKCVYPVVTKRVDEILITLYGNGNDNGNGNFEPAQHLNSLNPEASAEESNQCEAQLELPPDGVVWFCWLQGMEKAPELVRVCLENIRRNVTENVVVLDDHNYTDYVALPEHIVEKYKKGRIPGAMFSDMMRLELLIRYGGTWIDATVLASPGAGESKLWKEIGESELFVYRYFRNGKVEGISNWFIHAKAGNRLLMDVRDMLYAYWRDYNCVVEYYIFHLFFSHAAKKYPEMMARMPKGNSYHALLLRDNEHRMKDREWMDKLMANVPFHKLNWRKQYCFPQYETLALRNGHRPTITMNELFFEILQVAIGNRDMLTHAPSAEEWEEVYEVCKKQSLTGIAFAGVERLPQEQMPPGRRIRQWAVKADKIRERNAKVSRECVQVSKFFEKNGFDSVILKGQGNYAYYPEHLQGLRGAGDIDVWVRPKDKVNGNVNLNHNVRAVVEFCLSVKEGEYVYYHNMDFPILKDTPIEVHYRPTWLYNPFRNRALQRWFASQVQEGSSASQVQEVQRVQERAREFKVYDGYRIPSVEFNVVFQLLHLYKHIFEEGIGLRQLLDYYFVITSYETELKLLRNAPLRNVTDGDYETQGKPCYDNVELLNQRGARLELIKTLGLEGFAGAVMYVMQEVFAMPRERMLWEPNEKRGKKLLEEIMMGGNFGKFDERYNWAETTNGSMDYRGASYAITRLRHNFQFLSDYPSEVLWEPLFRVYHWMWRKFKLWRFE